MKSGKLKDPNNLS